MAYSTINKSTTQFNVLTWTGDGTSSRDITGAGFQPDLSLIKQRNGTFSWVIGNSTSGDNKFLVSNSNAAESTDSTKFRTFVSDGIQVGSHGGVNGNSNTYAAFNVKGNGGTEVSNTDGTITSNVQVNSTNGFSIVRYTGDGNSGSTVGHGLGSTPDFVISKHYSTTGDWNIYHESFSSQERIKLNSDGAKNTNSTIFNALPNSTVITMGNGGDINTNGGSHYFWCFKSIPGFSKFGTWTGNASTDGPFNYTGFKPTMLIWKRSDAINDWFLVDSTRDEGNETDASLFPGLNGAESIGNGYNGVDFLSNGFKVRQANAGCNASGGTYLWMAFGQTLVGSNNVPCTAR